jgi:hypothetical protein
MKFKLFLLTLICSISSYSQCFDCGHSIGGHVEDYVVDIDKASDGIVLTINPNQGWGRSIYKYDFNCNLIWTNTFMPDNSNPADSMGFIDTTVDNNDNVYSIIRNNRNGIIVDGFAIEMGISIIKLNADGAIEWVKKIRQYLLYWGAGNCCNCTSIFNESRFKSKFTVVQRINKLSKLVFYTYDFILQ